MQLPFISRRPFRGLALALFSCLVLTGLVAGLNACLAADPPSQGVTSQSKDKAAPTGEIKITVLRNGEPSAGYYYVYNQGESERGGENEKEPITEGPLEIGADAFKVAPGAYDVVVENTENADIPSLTLRGVTVEPGASVLKKAEFTGGALKVLIFLNGKATRGWCEIYKSAGDEQTQSVKVSENWVDPAGTVFKLTDGRYFLKIKNMDDAARTETDFPGITIKAGATVEQSAEFMAGSLSISAKAKGQPVRIFCAVYKAGPSDKPRASDDAVPADNEKEAVTTTMAVDGAAYFTLAPGLYRSKVVNLDDERKVGLYIEDIKIEPGAKLEKAVEFPASTEAPAD